VLSGGPSGCPSVRPATTISNDAIALYLVDGFHSHLTQIFIVRVGAAEKVFKARGQGHSDVKCTFPSDMLAQSHQLEESGHLAY